MATIITPPPTTKANGGVGTNLPYNRVPLVEANGTGGTVNLPTVCPDYNTAFFADKRRYGSAISRNLAVRRSAVIDGKKYSMTIMAKKWFNPSEIAFIEAHFASRQDQTIYNKLRGGWWRQSNSMALRDSLANI